jgi:hypothetical protein
MLRYKALVKVHERLLDERRARQEQLASGCGGGAADVLQQKLTSMQGAL